MDQVDMTQHYLSLLTAGRCSEELATLYSQIAQSFQQANYTAHIAELELLVGMASDQNIDPLEIVPAVDEILRMACERAFAMMALEVDPQMPIDMLAELTDILLGFDVTDTPELLLNALEASEDSIEGFCAFVEAQGTYAFDDWLPHIVKVDVNFIRNAKKLLRTEVSRLEAAGVQSADLSILRRLSRLLKAKRDSLGAELGSSHIGLGASLESLYVGQVGRLIDMPIDQAVDELYSMAVLSGASFEAAEISVSDCLDDLCQENLDLRRKAEQTRLQLAETYRTIFGEIDE